MLKHRLLMGPLLILGVLALAWGDELLDGIEASGAVAGPDGTLPPGLLFFVAAAIISVLAARELAVILRSKGVHVSRRVMAIAAIGGLILTATTPAHKDGLYGLAVVNTAAGVALFGSLAYSSRNRSLEGAVAAAGGTLLAFVYLGLMFGLVLAIQRDHSAWMLIWALLTIKSCDIGAFFTGRAIGRHKMIAWLSPGKTWEGFAGGVLLAALVGAAGLALLAPQVGPELRPAGGLLAGGALAGALFGAAGQVGDLVASMFKRDAGLKDSGRLVPGMGGVLDVIDSAVFVAPLAFWWFRLAS
ncbi:MAG: phosphatidate cytidylyltransferase [Phycisphaerales bacterium JB039]